ERFDPDAKEPVSSFGEPQTVDRRHESLGPTATDGTLTLRLPPGQSPIYRFDQGKPEPTPLYFLPATSLGPAHEQFWHPFLLAKGGRIHNDTPAALPLAD